MFRLFQELFTKIIYTADQLLDIKQSFRPLDWLILLYFKFDLVAIVFELLLRYFFVYFLYFDLFTFLNINMCF